MFRLLPAPPIPHLLCRESYHLGAHFGTILGPFGGGLGGFEMVFLVNLGILKFVKNSPNKPVLGRKSRLLSPFRGVWGRGPYIARLELKRAAGPSLRHPGP